MGNRKAFWALVAVVAAVVAVTAWVYPYLPPRMVTHWGLSGQPDGYMSRFWGAWMVPVISVVLAVLLWLLPAIDPRKENYRAFRGVYNAFVVGMVVFLAYVHLLSLAWNLGHPVPIEKALAPALGLLLVGVGVLVQRAQPNWFVGIRTPWTLSSPTVWQKTHRIAAPWFYLSGALALGALFWLPLLWVSIVVLLLAMAGVAAYSCFAYVSEQKRG